MLRHIGVHVSVAVEHRVKDGDGGVAVELALDHQGDEPGQGGGGEGHIRRLHAPGGQGTQHLAHNPVGRLLGGGAQVNHGLKEVGQCFLRGDHLGVVGGQAEAALIPLHSGRSQLWLDVTQTLQIVLRQLHWRQIGVGEVTVVLGVLLGAHGIGGVLVLVPAAGLLNDPLSLLQQLNLPSTLVLDGPCNGFEGVEVLHLGAGAQLRGACGAHRQVYVAAEGALLHFAVGHAQVLEGGAQLLQIGNDLLGGAEVGLGDNLDEGHAAAVVVAAGLVGPGVVDQLARVLLHVQLVDAHRLAAADVHPAVPGNGQVELGNLIGLGQVRVEVVLPVKAALFGDLTPQGQTGLDGKFQHLLVEYGQGAGHAGAHRTAVGVGCATEGGGAGAENFGGRGELHMGLQTDDGFPGHII